MNALLLYRGLRCRLAGLACAGFLIGLSPPAVGQESADGEAPATVEGEAAAPAAEAIWFYAEGEENGPLTADQIKKMYADGTLKGETKVRRKGPYNWAALSETEAFSDLFAWYYLKDGKRTGPVSSATMGQLYRAGTVTVQTSIWRPGMAAWKPLAEVPDMAAELKSSPTEPPPVSTAAVTQPPPTGTGGLAVRKGKIVGYKRERRRGLVIAGSVTFGVSWGGCAIVSAILGAAGADGCDSCGDFAETFWIPLVGPIVADQVNHPDSATRTLMMVMLTGAQATGAALFIAGMVGKKVPVYEKGPLYGWSVTPLVGPNQTTGVGLLKYW